MNQSLGNYQAQDYSMESSFRTLLGKTYLAKNKLNKSYSIRAYARYLGVSHATLSHLLSGKRPITKKTILKLGKRIGLNENQLNGYCGNHLDTEFKDLSHETFEAIQNWYHDAILELAKTKNFKASSAWIAKKLSISIVEARDAFNRLKNLGLLVCDSKGKWTPSIPDSTTQTQPLNTSAALRLYQQDLINKSLAALNLIPIEERIQSSLMIAIDTKDLPAVRTLIKEFNRKLNHYLSRPEASAESVYVFLLSGFPIIDS